MNTETVNQRIKKIVQHYEVSSYELSKILNTSTTRISHILNDRNFPNYELLKGICENFPEIDANWLLTGSGEMIIKQYQSCQYQRIENDINYIKSQINFINGKLK